MDIFQTLFEQHAMYKVYLNLKGTISYDASGNMSIAYQDIGRYLTNFLLSVVNYKAPNVNTRLKPK